MIDPALFDRRVLVADGNPADALRLAQPAWRGPIEALNLERTAAVSDVHAAYAAAGALLLRSNSEHACATALAAFGLAERAEACTNSGSALARNAPGNAAQSAPGGTARNAPGGTARNAPGGAAQPASRLVMGTLGAPPDGAPASDPAWRRAYGEQVVYLADTGVDFVLLQHVTRLSDALTLIECVQAVGDLPVLAALQFDAAGRTAEGHDARSAAATLAAAGADALGLSCGPGPAALDLCLDALLATGLPLAVLAGVCRADGSAPYAGAPALEPAAFAAWLAPLAAGGPGTPRVPILGGCCGVTPAHIRALAEAVERDGR